MTPTPIPAIKIPTELFMQSIGAEVANAFSDPITHIVIAGMVLAAVVGLVAAAFRTALRS